MTQAELDALPDASATFGYEDRVINGKTVRAVVLNPPIGVLWSSDDEPSFAIAADGTRWRIGWHNGVRYKQRVLSPM